MTQENEEQKVKVKGPKITPPRELNLPTNSTYTSWKRSLEAQLEHQKTVSDEAKKTASIHGYQTKLKVSKKYRTFFDEEVKDARKRAKHKKRK